MIGGHCRVAMHWAGASDRSSADERVSGATPTIMGLMREVRAIGTSIKMCGVGELEAATMHQRTSIYTMM
ncbi:unnamed protein product, partial [Mesorhabditis belari]|uniref:Uncharacterized protein n=1 Tax=Mesorhabditis belari TaxID=2138241 RepID=A0AAF3FL11_9BILA